MSSAVDGRCSGTVKKPSSVEVDPKFASAICVTLSGVFDLADILTQIRDDAISIETYLGAVDFVEGHLLDQFDITIGSNDGLFTVIQREAKHFFEQFWIKPNNELIAMLIPFFCGMFFINISLGSAL
jgi:hypothetical protein